MECLRGGRWWLLLLLGDELMGMKLAPLAVLLMMMAGGRGRERLCGRSQGQPLQAARALTTTSRARTPRTLGLCTL